jgi:hypothetical protein
MNLEKFNLTNLTEDILHKNGIVNMNLIQESDFDPFLYIDYKNGESEYIKGEKAINRFLSYICK